MIKINVEMIQKGYESIKKKNDANFSQILMSKKLKIQPMKLNRILRSKNKSIDLIVLLKLSIFSGLKIDEITNINEVQNKLKKQIK
jgi:hypothetical protein